LPVEFTNTGWIGHHGTHAPLKLEDAYDEDAGHKLQATRRKLQVDLACAGQSGNGDPDPEAS
jgi:hypothetical protein